jgi:hypothetical protein
MRGDEWLERVFEPALRTDDPAVHPQLRGALHALRDCGVLSPEAAAHAESRLDARFDWLAEPEVVAPVTTARPTHDALEAVLAPACALADVDGLTVLLVSVELWTSCVVLRLAGLRSAFTDELEAEYRAAMGHWVTLADEAQASGERVPAPHAPGERLARLDLRLADDAGTRYEAAHRQAGGSGSEWRAEWHFGPGVPARATRLAVAVGASDVDRPGLELALPARG